MSTYGATTRAVEYLDLSVGRRPAREVAVPRTAEWGFDYEAWTHEELADFARQIALPGRSGATRRQLIEMLRGH